MKRSLIYLLILCLVSCAGEIEDRYLSNGESSISDNWIFDAADNAFREFYPAKSRSNTLSNKRLAVVTNKKSRSEDADTILSIVNYADSEGFVVIDNHKKEILAVSDNGEIEPEEIDNPGIQIFLNCAIDYSTNDNVTSGNTIEINDSCLYPYPYSYVEPRSPYAWGQEFPAGNLCRNKIAGCAPLALALALAYFEKPASMIINDLNSNIPRQIDWKEMKENVVSRRYSELKSKPFITDSDYDENWEFVEPEPKAEKDLACVCREIGYRAGSWYLNNGTFTDFYSLYHTATRLDSTLCISGIYESYPHALSLINDDGIIYMGASADYAGQTIGHAWIIDGYKMMSSIIQFPGSLHEKPSKLVEYQHHNWGWYGECNGYYHSGVFSQAGAKEYDFPYIDNSLDLDFNISLLYFTIKNKK